MIRIIAAAGVLAAFAHTAHAAQATGTLHVQATVLNTCVVATTPVVFANVGLTAVTANGGITVSGFRLVSSATIT